MFRRYRPGQDMRRPAPRSGFRFLRILPPAAALFILCAACEPLYAQAGRRQVLEGNRFYGEEKYDEANNRYQDALLEDPGSPLIQFNVGDVLYKKGNFEKSMESFQKAVDADDPIVQSQVYYNIGNSLYRQNKLPESILAYEQALKLNPGDQDAKYNLEFVRNKLKENVQPENQQQQQQQEQQQQQQQQQQQEQQDSEKQEQKDEQKDEESRQQQSGDEKQEMTKEQAEQLLEALKEDQKDKKEQEKVQAQGKVRVLKDW